MALPNLDYPLSPPLNKSRRMSLHQKFVEPEREDLTRCAKEDGEIRPTVVIHYMPHRTFETPILCTCVPTVEPNLLLNATVEASNLLSSVTNLHSKSNINLSTIRHTPTKTALAKEKSRSVTNLNRVKLQPTKTKRTEGRFRVVVNQTTQSERPFLKSSTRPVKPATSCWTLNVTRQKSSSFKRYLMKPYQQLKRKLTKKTLDVQNASLKMEPYCRFAPIDHDFPTVTI